MNHRIISTQIRQDFVIKEQNAQNQLSCSEERGLMGNKANRVFVPFWLVKIKVDLKSELTLFLCHPIHNL